MKTISIRSASANDATSVAELSGELGYEAVSTDVRGRIEGILQDPDHALFVATLENGVIVGWVHVLGTKRVMAGPFAELGGMIVSERHRSAGVGKLLLQRAEQWALAHGYGVMRVRSRIDRVRAHEFYVREGYVLYKSQKIFEKGLSPAEK